MPFGQVVIGPAGSGKTTYCTAMAHFLRSLGRSVAIVNLDPANDFLPYDADVNIADLITVDDAMTLHHLGPNGALIYCMEYLEKNVDWLLERLASCRDKYVLFDFPGQVELYTHHDSVHNILQCLRSASDRQLVAIHLVDAHYCTDPGKFISVLLTSLSTMLHTVLPHINVLSKADLIERDGELKFGLDYYTDVQDLSYLVDLLQDDPFLAKYKSLNEKLVGVVEDYSLVSFISLSIQDKDAMCRVKEGADRAVGYVFGPQEERSMTTSHAAAGAELPDGGLYTS